MSLSAEFCRIIEDRYALDRQIGEGGMATVYLARDTRHQRPVSPTGLPSVTTARVREVHPGVESFDRPRSCVGMTRGMLMLPAQRPNSYRCCAKNSLCSRRSSGIEPRTAIRFGIAISPFNVSETSQITCSDPVAPR